MAKSKIKYRNRFVRKSNHKKSITIPLAVVAGFVPEAVGVWNRRNSPAEAGNFMAASLTGYMPGYGFTTVHLKNGAFPILAGFATHWVASQFGINRMLGRMGVPFIRI